MAFTVDQYAALKDELTNDPEGIGYAGHNEHQIAALLNAPGRDTILAPPISGNDFLSSVDKGELVTGGLSSQGWQWLNLVAGDGPLSIGDAGVQTAINTLFPSGSFPKTHAALTALGTSKSVSRAEKLLGEGTVVTSDDVLTAQRQ